MITGKEKAWAGTVIGILVSVLSYISAELVDGGTAKTALVTVSAVVAIVGTGLGVYSVPNTPPAPAVIKENPPESPGVSL